MTRSCLLFCEGAHDQAALAIWLQKLGNWSRASDSELPDVLKRGIPSAGQGRKPDHLKIGDTFFAIRGLGGLNEVLGRAGTTILAQYRPDALFAFGIVVDLDTATVQSRLQSYCTHYAGVLGPIVHQVVPGRVQDTLPRTGIWLAPNNQASGALDNLIAASFDAAKPALIEKATRYIDSIPQRTDRVKAILGAAGQHTRPGGALADALRNQNGDSWIPRREHMPADIEALLAFLGQLVDVN